MVEVPSGPTDARVLVKDAPDEDGWEPCGTSSIMHDSTPQSFNVVVRSVCYYFSLVNTENHPVHICNKVYCCFIHVAVVDNTHYFTCLFPLSMSAGRLTIWSRKLLIDR